MTKAITKQKAFVEQCETALQHYVAEAKAGRHGCYGDLNGLIRTAQDVACVQWGKLLKMEQGAGL